METGSNKPIYIPIKDRWEQTRLYQHMHMPSWECCFKKFTVEEAIDMIIKHLGIQVEVTPATKEQVKIVLDKDKTS